MRYSLSQYPIMGRVFARHRSTRGVGFADDLNIHAALKTDLKVVEMRQRLEIPLTLKDPQGLYVAIKGFNMNRSTRPAYKHELLYFPPFVLTDRLETHQQAIVLLLGYRRYFVHVVASHVLCSFEFDGQKLFGDHIQADAIHRRRQNLS
jgi:hypothetical protein